MDFAAAAAAVRFSFPAADDGAFPAAQVNRAADTHAGPCGDVEPIFRQAMLGAVQQTSGERALANPAGGSGLFSLDYDEKLFRHNYRHPILVSAVSVTGPKLDVAAMARQYEAVGIDLVAIAANDVLVLGGEPLFMLACLAGDGLEPQALEQVLAGIAEGCKQAGCSLLGGKAAPPAALPAKGWNGLAGFLVGVVEKRRIVASRARPGDALVGLPSAGLHCDGYATVQRLLFDQQGMRWDDSLAGFGIARTLAEELLTPVRIYVKAVRSLLRHYPVKRVVHGIAHVAEGGLLGSVRRLLLPECAARLAPAAWQRPRIFDVVQELGGVAQEQMYGTFNMGIGMVLAVSPYYVESTVGQLRHAGEEAAIIGEVARGNGGVVIG
jgi:phosphoribosylformylglycinamidine cyclo-ligase